MADKNKPADTRPRFVGDLPAGPLGEVLNAAGGAIADAGRAVGGFLSQPAPNFPIRTDVNGNPLPTGTQIPEKSYPMDPTPYIQRGIPYQPVMNGQGQVIGYAPVQGLKPRVAPTTPTTDTVANDDATRRANAASAARWTAQVKDSTGEQAQAQANGQTPTGNADATPVDSNTRSSATGPYKNGVLPPGALAGATSAKTLEQLAKEAEAEAKRREAANVMAIVTKQFNDYGLGDMAPYLAEWATQGLSEDEITLKARETEPYKRKFGNYNAQRIKAGLPVLSEAQIVDQRAAYREAQRSAGLPSSFYDTDEELDAFALNNISAVEVKARAQKAVQVAKSQDPALLASFAQMGIGVNDLATFMLDPSKGEQYLQKKFDTAAVMSEGIRSGIDTTEAFAGSLVDKGIGKGAARAAFQNVAADGGYMTDLAAIEQMPLTAEEQVGAELNIDAEAATKVRGLKSRERARFSGASGGTRATGGQSMAGTF